MDRDCYDGNQELLFSSIGGVIKRWKFGGVDIFYPQETLEISGRPKLRGGMHPCWPNFGSADPKFGLPQHGPLRIREANISGENDVFFVGTDLLGSTCNVQSAVRIIITLMPRGFLYTLMARLTEPSPTNVFVNGGFHPYFRTPRGVARVIVGEELVCIDEENILPRRMKAKRSTYVLTPGIGTIRMTTSGVWNTRHHREMTLWRDSKKYVCVEPTMRASLSSQYGDKHCLWLTNDWLLITCEFEVFLD
jgi:glucose-6-phosphate 1-epimerase